MTWVNAQPRRTIMRVNVRCAAVGAVTSVAMMLASASPALAATHRPAKAKPVHFNVHGVVVAVHGNSVKVLTSTAKVGSKTVHNKVVTVTLTKKTKKTKHAREAQHAHSLTAATPDPAAPVVGTDIAAVGTVIGSTLVATSEMTTVLPAEALVGQVTAVSTDGSQFTVATHDQVDGDHAEHDDNPGTTVTTAGAAVTGSAVAAGEYVVVLGESAEHEMLAAKIYTFATAPTLAVGSVTASDQTAKTLTVDAQGAEHDGQDEGDQPDGSNPQVSVDASNAEIIVNGATPAAPTPAASSTSGTTPSSTPAPAAFPAVGDEVLTVGTAGSSPDTLVASLVFDFNQADNGTVQDNQENEDQGDNGEHSQPTNG
jgi:hypothetical protein